MTPCLGVLDANRWRVREVRALRASVLWICGIRAARVTAVRVCGAVVGQHARRDVGVDVVGRGETDGWQPIESDPVHCGPHLFFGTRERQHDVAGWRVDKFEAAINEGTIGNPRTEHLRRAVRMLGDRDDVGFVA